MKINGRYLRLGTAAVLKILTYYAQYYAHVCLKFDCSIRVYSQNY